MLDANNCKNNVMIRVYLALEWLNCSQIVYNAMVAYFINVLVCRIIIVIRAQLYQEKVYYYYALITYLLTYSLSLARKASRFKGSMNCVKNCLRLETR